MSVNIQTNNGLRKIADITTKDNIKNALGYVPLNPEKIDKIYSDDNILSIEDYNGYIIANISNNGISTTSLSLKDSLFLDDSILEISDTFDNIILRVSESGFNTTSIISKSISTDNLTISDKILTKSIEVSDSLIGNNLKISNDLSITNISSENDYLEIVDSVGNIAFKVDKDGTYATTIYSNGDLVATQNYVLSVMGSNGATAKSSSLVSTFFTNNNSTLSRVDKSQYILSPVISYGGVQYRSLPFQQFTDETYLTEVFTTVESDVTLQAYITIHFNGTYFEISNIKTCKPLEFMAATESDWEHGYAFDIPYVYAIPIS